MAIDFGSGLSGATSAVLARTPSVRKSESRDSDRVRFDQRNPAQPRVGFGEGTVSALGVAATTVDRNLEAARKIVPTLEELSVEARARTQAVREEATETEHVRLDRASESSLRNENAARAQAVGFGKPVEESGDAKTQTVREREPVFGPSAREVDSVVSFVVPEPVASFDTFG